MKKIILFYALLIASGSFLLAQQTYYNDVNLTLSGLALKDELAVKVTSTHTAFLSYAEAYLVIRDTDEDLNNSNNVLLIYNSQSTSKQNDVGGTGTGADVWNREHVYAQSLGTPDLGTAGPGSDVHHLRACEQNVNSLRGNQRFDDGTGIYGNTASGFYPGDEWKGDVARMIMFMYLRYGMQCLPSNVGVGSSAATPDDMIDLFLDWNAEDPVSPIEDQRNTILEGVQGNRNPFIDNPYLATRIWGGPAAQDRWGIYTVPDTEAPTVPQNLLVFNETPTSFTLGWDASTDNVGVTGYDIFVNGVFNTSVTTVSSVINGLAPETTYSLSVLAKDDAGNLSALSTPVNGTTTTAGSGANELFISEYVEGTSNNRAIELANFTGNPINLAEYSLAREGNGAGGWRTPLALSGTLNNGEAYVIANANASTAITNIADLSTNADALIITGNDAIGLFKNSVLVDIIGVLGGGSGNFAQDVTLRRKPEISSPNTTYTIAEWETFAVDTFDGLGSHNFTLGINTLPESTFLIYPNPAKNILHISTKTNLLVSSVSLYTLNGQKILENSHPSNPIKLGNLAPGVYFIKITSGKQQSIKKIVLQ